MSASEYKLVELLWSPHSCENKPEVKDRLGKFSRERRGSDLSSALIKHSIWELGEESRIAPMSAQEWSDTHKNPQGKSASAATSESWRTPLTATHSPHHSRAPHRVLSTLVLLGTWSLMDVPWLFLAWWKISAPVEGQIWQAAGAVASQQQGSCAGHPATPLLWHQPRWGCTCLPG